MRMRWRAVISARGLERCHQSQRFAGMGETSKNGKARHKPLAPAESCKFSFVRSFGWFGVFGIRAALLSFRPSLARMFSYLRNIFRKKSASAPAAGPFMVY